MIISNEIPVFRESYLRKYGVYVKRYTPFFTESDEVKIENVVFNPPATIVFWSDGSKTVVKCMEGDTFDKQTGLAMAICKRIFSDRFHSEFKRWCDKDE